jgi:hypothetical protein
MAIKPHNAWHSVGVVTLRNQYHVERSADTYRIRSVIPRDAEFGQAVEGKVLRYLAKALEAQTVTVEEAEKALVISNLRLPYHYGYKLHFFAQNALVALVASRQASHRRVGRRFEYDIA